MCALMIIDYIGLAVSDYEGRHFGTCPKLGTIAWLQFYRLKASASLTFLILAACKLFPNVDVTWHSACHAILARLISLQDGDLKLNGE
jgi:hypothetical protein